MHVLSSEMHWWACFAVCLFSFVSLAARAAVKSNEQLQQTNKQITNKRYNESKHTHTNKQASKQTDKQNKTFLPFHHNAFEKIAHACLSITTHFRR
jgi:uncharacterized protein involved in copper resistance